VEPEGSLPHLQEPDTCPYPEPPNGMYFCTNKKCELIIQKVQLLLLCSKTFVDLNNLKNLSLMKDTSNHKSLESQTIKISLISDLRKMGLHPHLNIYKL
jgi:hypothetical protein